MRLLEITNDFPPMLGGIENYTYSLVNRWPSEDVMVVAPEVPGAAEFDRTVDYEIVRIPSGRVLLPTRRLVRTVADVARRHQTDVIHFSSPFPVAFLGPRLLEETGIPYAVTLHGSELVCWGSLPASGALMRRSLQRASVLLPVSTFTARAARRLVPKRTPPCIVVTPGVDCDRFAPPPGTSVPSASRPEKGPVVLAVSRLVARKGPATLIRAMPSVLERIPEAQAVIVGGGRDRQRLERMAEGLGISRCVRFAGPQPWHDMPRFYREADVFALPTRERFGGLETEGFPLVYLEAAACGLPAVAGEAGGVRDAVLDGVTGYVVDGRSAGEVSATLVRLLEDPGHARLLGEQGRHRVTSQFSWDHVATQFRAVLSEHVR
jgi:phosphatidylinositol alpha-1,6-mannosyltransferase